MTGPEGAGVAAEVVASMDDARIERRAPHRVQTLEGLDQEVLTMQERARLLQDEISSKLAEESNRSLHTLTVLTALFLPPTLIAGIFGMNTGGLPFEKTPFGSFWAFVLGIASAGAVFWFLRRSGVIRK